MRSASRRLFTKMMVERWARTSSSRRGWMAGQIERRSGKPATPSETSAASGETISPRCFMSSTGTSTRRSKALRAPASTIDTGRGFQALVPSPPPR